MKQEDFSLALNALLPGCNPEAASKWAEFAVKNVEHEQFPYFIPMEHDAAVEKWLDAIFAGLYTVNQEYGADIAAKVADLSCQRCGLYPGEMLPAAEMLKNDRSAERLRNLMTAGLLDEGQPFFFDLPDGAALARQGPEIPIAQSGVSCGLIQKRTEPGFLLADGTALLESEKDTFGRYRGGAGMDGMYLQTGRLYAPVRDADGQIHAFQEVKPSVDREREREVTFLAGRKDALAIYRLKDTHAPDDIVPLARLQKSGESPLAGNYNLIHVVQLLPGADPYKVLEACRAAATMKPGDIAAIKQEDVVTCWYMDQLSGSKLPGLLDNYLKAAEIGAEQNYNQIDGIIDNEAPKPSILESVDEAVYLVGGTTYLHVQASEDARNYTRDDCYTTYGYTLYDKDTRRQLDAGCMEIVEDVRDDPRQCIHMAAKNILDCRTQLGGEAIEPVSMDVLDMLRDASTKEIPAAEGRTAKSSVLDTLRRCRENAGQSQRGTNPPSPGRDPER